MNSRVLGGIEGKFDNFVGRLSFGLHCDIMKGISTTDQKLNKEYKPLGAVAVLAIGGLLSGLLWSAFFVANPAGTIQERRVAGSPSLIPQAEGAEIDSAALTPQSAPFLASADTQTGSIQLAENVDVLYGEGALKDSQPVQKIKANAPAGNTVKKLASGVIYTTLKRDTLQSISTMFGVPINTIVEFNPSVNFSALVPGVSIIIPSQKDIASFSG